MPSTTEHQRSFELFGSEVRLLIGAPTIEGLPSPQIVAMQIEGFLRTLHARLTRFVPESELSALNSDPAPSHLSSGLLMTAIEAALWAAQRSGGIVDPTVIGQLERAGYSASRVGVAPAPLAEALAWAPPRAPARPDPGSDWRRFEVDRESGTITRPRGARIDLGGVGKGLAADLASERLSGYATHCVDAGGDLRIGGEEPVEREVAVTHPFESRPAISFRLASGAVATSGLATRVWRTDDGFAHHLIDPGSGRPAWTGVVQATALAETALSAETLAKAALLSGPERAAELLGGGGAIVLDDGTVRSFGSLAGGPAPRLEMAA